jgi:RNA-directed DNA polymerase
LNQELKLKWHSIYGQILFDRKLKTAWEKVKSNDGAGGIDGETIQSYASNEEKNLNLLQQNCVQKNIHLHQLGENTFQRKTENFVHWESQI